MKFPLLTDRDTDGLSDHERAVVAALYTSFRDEVLLYLVARIRADRVAEWPRAYQIDAGPPEESGLDSLREDLAKKLRALGIHIDSPFVQAELSRIRECIEEQQPF